MDELNERSGQRLKTLKDVYFLARGFLWNIPSLSLNSTCSYVEINTEKHIWSKMHEIKIYT